MRRDGCGEEVVFKASTAGNVAEEEKGQDEKERSLTQTTQSLTLSSTSSSRTSTTSTTSTSSSSAESSTAPATERYLVYPVSGASEGELSAFSRTLQEELGQDNVEIVPDIGDNTVLLWIATLTLSQLEMVSGSQVVSCFVKGRLELLDTKYL